MTHNKNYYEKEKQEAELQIINLQYTLKGRLITTSLTSKLTRKTKANVGYKLLISISISVEGISNLHGNMSLYLFFLTFSSFSPVAVG